MTGFILIGLATIAALTATTCTTLVMQAKERMHTRRQNDYTALQRESLGLAARANRDIAKSLGARMDDDS